MTKRTFLLAAFALVAALALGTLMGCTLDANREPEGGVAQQAHGGSSAAEAVLTGPALYEFYTDW